MSRSLHPIASSERLNDIQNVATVTAASDSFNTSSDAFSSPPDATAPAATSSLFESEAQLYYDKAFRALGFSELVRRFVYYEDEWPHEEPLRCALIAIESEPVPEPLEYDASILEALIERYGFRTEIAHGFAEGGRATRTSPIARVAVGLPENWQSETRARVSAALCSFR